jgi:endonuclease/exonuclease/phosphatase family metal-dependent hydrolase
VTATIGLQLVRVFMATTNFYLVDAVGAQPAVGGGLALTVFLVGSGLPLLMGPGRRRKWGLPVGGILLAVLRVGEHIVQEPGVDLLVSSLGVAAFLFVLTALTTGPSTSAGLGVLVGVSLDVALLGSSWTLDLSWLDGPAPLALVSALAAGLIAGVLVCSFGNMGGGSSGYAAVLGPWLVLEMVVFANLGLAGSVTGFTLPAVWMLVAAGAAVAVAVATWLVPTRRTALGLGVLLIGSVLVLATSSGPWTAVAVVAGQVAAGVLLAVTLRRSSSSRPWGVASGLLAMVVLLFLYYGSYEFDMGFRSSSILIVCAIAVTVGGFAASESRSHPIFTSSPALAATVLMLPAIAVWLLWSPPAHVAPEAVDQVRIMSYNVHQGFNTAGRLDIEELARVIESESADIIALQEVSRGWVVDGSLDVLAWLSNRLGLPFVSGPTADGQWGNAVLSRYPIVDAHNVPLPPDDLPLRRGYLDVVIDPGGETVRVIATHLHHIGAEEQARIEQARALVTAWDGRPRTVVIGDLNASPTSRPLEILLRGGLIDAAFSDGFRRATSPAGDPRRTIDYILTTPDLDLSRISVIETEASDHLPVAITVALRR